MLRKVANSNAIFQNSIYRKWFPEHIPEMVIWNFWYSMILNEKKLATQHQKMVRQASTRVGRTSSKWVQGHVHCWSLFFCSRRTTIAASNSNVFDV